jgi:hypothetical protein
MPSIIEIPKDTLRWNDTERYTNNAMTISTTTNFCRFLLVLVILVVVVVVVVSTTNLCIRIILGDNIDNTDNNNCMIPLV